MEMSRDGDSQTPQGPQQQLGEVSGCCEMLCSLLQPMRPLHNMSQIPVLLLSSV